MFARVARRYDLMNQLMTAGQDQRWRQETICLARLSPGALLLDLGSGTGELARQALRQEPTSQVIAVDFTFEMMRYSQSGGNFPRAAADALETPFPDNTFKAVVSGFLMRNVSNLQQALQEQYRILKPGGRIVILETTPPKRNWLRPLAWLYLHVMIPVLALLVTGQPRDYIYLSVSTDGFLRAEELAIHMAITGFKKIVFQRRMLGMIAIHWGEK